MRNRWPLARTWLVRGVMLLAALPLLLALLVALPDWNHAKPWLVHQAVTVLSREVRVEGPISLSWRMGPDDGTLVSRLLPQLHFTASQLTVGNPAWAAEGDLLHASRVDLTFSPWSLLHRHWHLSDMRLDGLELLLQRDAQQRKNWRFSDHPRSPWSVELHAVRFDRLLVRYIDQPLDLDLVFRAQGPAQQGSAMRSTTGTAGPAATIPALALEAAVSGRYGQADVQGRVRGGALPDLLNEGSVYPLQAEGEIAQVHAAFSGQLLNPHQLVRADLHLRLSGDSLAQLYAATGVPLPASKPFSTAGALSIARMDGASGVWDWRYTHFTGKVGESDVAGDARYLKGPPRNKLTVTAHAQQWRLSDFFPAATAGKAAGAASAASGRVFSGKTMQVQRWARLDADITLQAQRVELRPGLEWQDASTTIRLQDQVLTAAPLRFAMAGGKGEGALSLDGRAPQISSHLQMQLHEVQVRQLFPRLPSLQASAGRLDAQAELRGTGHSVAAMLASAEGEIKADLGPGTISRFILEAAGLNVANAVFARLYQDQPARLLCGAADVVIRDGQADIRRGLVNTEDAVIDISGRVDLAREELALDIHPRARKLRILSLRTPLYVRGTLARPELSASKEALVARAGAAAALALVAPVAAVIPLISPGQALPEDCAPHPQSGATLR